MYSSFLSPLYLQDSLWVFLPSLYLGEIFLGLLYFASVFLPVGFCFTCMLHALQWPMHVVLAYPVLTKAPDVLFNWLFSYEHFLEMKHKKNVAVFWMSTFILAFFGYFLWRFPLLCSLFLKYNLLPSNNFNHSHILDSLCLSRNFQLIKCVLWDVFMFLF